MGPYIREARESVREDVMMEAEAYRRTGDNTILLALKAEGGTLRQGMWTVTRSWKKQGNKFTPRAFQRNSGLLIP